MDRQDYHWWMGATDAQRLQGVLETISGKKIITGIVLDKVPPNWTSMFWWPVNQHGYGAIGVIFNVFQQNGLLCVTAAVDYWIDTSHLSWFVSLYESNAVYVVLTEHHSSPMYRVHDFYELET